MGGCGGGPAQPGMGYIFLIFLIYPTFEIGFDVSSLARGRGRGSRGEPISEIWFDEVLGGRETGGSRRDPNT